MLLKLFFVEIIVLLLIAWAALFERGRYFVPVIIGLTARVLLIWVHENTLLFGSSDIGDYLLHFKKFEQHLEQGKLYWGVHVPAYTTLYPGWIYAIFWPRAFWMIRLVNAVISLFVLIPIVRIYRLVFKRPMSPKMSLLVVLWPTWIRYSIEVGRSAITTLPVLFAVALLLELVVRFSWRKAFVALVAVLVSVVLRVHSIGFFVVPLVYFVIVRIKRERNRYLRFLLYPVAIGFVLLTIAGAIRFYLVFTAGTVYDIRSINQLTAIVSFTRQKGGSVYLAGVYPSSFIDLVWYLPLHAFYFMFSPMPWDAGKAFVIGSSLQAWILLALVVVSLRYNRQAYVRNLYIKVLTVTLLFVAIGFGAVTKNAGGAERWRLPITLILLPIISTLARPAVSRKENQILSPQMPETAPT